MKNSKLITAGILFFTFLFIQNVQKELFSDSEHKAEVISSYLIAAINNDVMPGDCTLKEKPVISKSEEAVSVRSKVIVPEISRKAVPVISVMASPEIRKVVIPAIRKTAVPEMTPMAMKTSVCAVVVNSPCPSIPCSSGISTSRTSYVADQM